MIHYADNLEEAVGTHLIEQGIEFVHESQNKDQRLDFYIPEHDVFIEVKKFHSPRINAQMETQNDIIVLQGKLAVKLFCKMNIVKK